MNRVKKSILISGIVLIMCSCNSTNTISSLSSVQPSLYESNSLEFDPFLSTSSSNTSSFLNSISSSQIVNLDNIIGTYKGIDNISMYEELIITINNDGICFLKCSDTSLNIKFSFKENNGDFYFFVTEDAIHELSVYKFINNKRISVDLDNGEYVEEYSLLLENAEFLA